MKRVLVGLALAAVGCVSETSDFGSDSGEVGDIKQALYIDGQGGGWMPGADALACTYQAGATCYFSGSTSASGGLRVKVVSDTIAGWPSSMSSSSARNRADALLQFVVGAQFFTQGGCSDNTTNCFDTFIQTDSNIASPNTLPNTDQPWRQFVRFDCTRFDELDEGVLSLDGKTVGPHTDQFGQMRLCKVIRARVDVGSFVSWVALWASTSAQKQAALNKLYGHIFTVVAGVGNSSSYALASINNTMFQRGNDGSPNFTWDTRATCPVNVNWEQFPGRAAFSQTTDCL